MSASEIDWQRLDKKKFFFVGAGLFSGVTTCLYPLSVVKTRQMALAGSPTGLKGAAQTAAAIVRLDGVRGLYRGFGTVVFGTIPARGVYLTTLEMVKSSCTVACERAQLSPTETAALCNGVGGAVASLATQSVIVPIDVVSQRLQMGDSRPRRGASPTVSATAAQRTIHSAAAAAAAAPSNGFQLACHIVRTEGVIGLYRGFGASVATFVPSSAIWWGAYGGYQKFLWQQLDRRRQEAGHAAMPASQVMLVQTGASVMAGATSSVLTNPLDVIKTRLQVADPALPRSFAGTAKQLIRQDGVAGLWRGVGPRMISAMLWGTCMVSAYEFLKRTCARPQESGDE